jgi:hypothetical protein
LALSRLYCCRAHGGIYFVRIKSNQIKRWRIQTIDGAFVDVIQAIDCHEFNSKLLNNPLQPIAPKAARRLSAKTRGENHDASSC